jgi:hypothetical protein
MIGTFPALSHRSFGSQELSVSRGHHGCNLAFFRKICREAHEMLLVSDSYPKLLIQIPFHKWNDDLMIRNGLINLYLFLEFSG